MNLICWTQRVDRKDAGCPAITRYELAFYVQRRGPLTSQVIDRPSVIRHDSGMNIPAGPITYLIKFDVLPEKRELFLSLLNDVLDAMRHEPTFHEAILHRDVESENRFMLYETWSSHEDVMNVQLHRPYREKWHQALPTLLVGSRDIGVFVPMRADRNADRM